MSVKRYDIGEGYGGPRMQQCPDGDWVAFDEYERICAELDALRNSTPVPPAAVAEVRRE